jgi:hypothetical protein
MEAPPPYPGLNTAPQNYAPYSQMAFPAYGQPFGQPVGQPYAANGGPNYGVYQNGGATAAAPTAPQPPGFSFSEKPPTYDEAIKKTQ